METDSVFLTLALGIGSLNSIQARTEFYFNNARTLSSSTSFKLPGFFATILLRRRNDRFLLHQQIQRHAGINTPQEIHLIFNDKYLRHYRATQNKFMQDWRQEDRQPVFRLHDQPCAYMREASCIPDKFEVILCGNSFRMKQLCETLS